MKTNDNLPIRFVALWFSLWAQPTALVVELTITAVVRYRLDIINESTKKISEQSIQCWFLNITVGSAESYQQCWWIIVILVSKMSDFGATLTDHQHKHHYSTWKITILIDRRVGHHPQDGHYSNGHPNTHITMSEGGILYCCIMIERNLKSRDWWRSRSQRWKDKHGEHRSKETSSLHRCVFMTLLDEQERLL
jgi:hypothetical protein